MMASFHLYERVCSCFIDMVLLPPALSTDEMAALDMETVYKKSTVNLKEILKNPGVWDPFILCYIDVSRALPRSDGTRASNVKQTLCGPMTCLYWI